MTDATKPAPATVPSPCVNICVLDPATGWCTGCWRSIDEIAAWGALDDDTKRSVLARLPARRGTLKGVADGEH